MAPWGRDGSVPSGGARARPGPHSRARGRQTRSVPPDLGLLWLRRAELYLHASWQKACRRTWFAEPLTGLHPNAFSAGNRQREGQSEVRLDQRLYRRCRGAPGLRLEPRRSHLRHLSSGRRQTVRRNRFHAAGAFLQARALLRRRVDTRAAEHGLLGGLELSAHGLSEMGRVGIPMGAPRREEVRRAGSSVLVLGSVE